MVEVKFWCEILVICMYGEKQSECPHWLIDGMCIQRLRRKQLYGCLCRPVTCRCRSCLLYPPSLFLLYDVNGRVLPTGTVILRI